MVRKVGDKYYVLSESGKRLSQGYKSERDAKERLQEIEYFKHKEESK